MKLKLSFAYILALPLALLTMGADKCSKSECATAQAAVALACRDESSATCLAAVEAADRSCTPKRPTDPLPTPPPTAPPATPIPLPRPTPVVPSPIVGDIPHGDWRGPWARTPVMHEIVNQTLREITGCEIGSDCVVAPGSGKVGHEQGWKNYDAFQVRFVEALRRKGKPAGFHTEPEHPDEACVVDAADGSSCEGYKVATNGGDIKVAWAGFPSTPCTGGGDEHGFPAGKGCPGVGGGSYRGWWTFAWAPSEPVSPPLALFPRQPVSVVKLHRVGRARVVIDATPQTGPNQDHCKAIGKVDAAGFGRQFCPLGPECCAEGEDCSKGPNAEPTHPQCLALRALREQYEREAGPWVWKRNGTPDGGPANDATPNPLQFVFPGAITGDTIELCAGNGICGHLILTEQF